MLRQQRHLPPARRLRSTVQRLPAAGDAASIVTSRRLQVAATHAVCVMLSTQRAQMLLRTGPDWRLCQCLPFVHVIGARCWPGRLAAGLRALYRLCRGPQLHG